MAIEAGKQPLELTAEALAERIDLAVLWAAATRRIVKRNTLHRRFPPLA
jgi:hypothetical protein